MKGLWARESQALSTLGSNPTLSKRQVGEWQEKWRLGLGI